MNDDDTSRNPGMLSRHPFLVALFVCCALAGALIGAMVLTDDWSLVRKLLAGAVAGTGVALLVTGPKLMIGS